MVPWLVVIVMVESPEFGTVVGGLPTFLRFGLGPGAGDALGSGGGSQLQGGAVGAGAGSKLQVAALAGPDGVGEAVGFWSLPPTTATMSQMSRISTTTPA